MDLYVYKNYGRVTLSFTNKDILDLSALILRSLGESVVITSFPPRVSSSGVVGKKVVYQLCFNPSTEYPTRVARKRIVIKSRKRRRSIISI